MPVRRILVAIDASPGSLLAARAAARLAARLKAELEGLFVEDVRLLRLVQAPLAREVGSITGGFRHAGSAELKRQLRLQGIRAEEALRRLAEREGIRWSFRIARGAVSSEIAAAAEQAEIVCLGHVGWSANPQRALGAAASALIERQSACTLLMRRALDVGTPVLVLYDGTEQAKRGLQLATQIAGDESDALKVLLVGPPENGLETAVAEQLEKAAEDVIIGSVASSAEPQLARILQRAKAGSIVVPVGGNPKHRGILQGILEIIECPVLLVS